MVQTPGGSGLAASYNGKHNTQFPSSSLPCQARQSFFIATSRSKIAPKSILMFVNSPQGRLARRKVDGTPYSEGLRRINRLKATRAPPPPPPPPLLEVHTPMLLKCDQTPTWGLSAGMRLTAAPPLRSRPRAA